MVVIKNAELKSRASFKTGGSADTLILPESKNELISALKTYENPYVFGNLSNTLITDKGIRGNVIITTETKEIQVNGNEITASCGVQLSRLAIYALNNSLKNAEFCYGIPGTVGGAVFMNAGAYGGEIKDILKSVTLFSKEKGVFTLNNDEMNFSYRKSLLQKENYILIDATFVLESGNPKEIKGKMDDYMSRRREKQPLEYPSCGSTFKRPEGFFAGALIEECGLKRARIGGAEVSEKHAGFIINKGNATSDDILALIAYVKATVKAKKGVNLCEEIRIAGEK